MGFIEPEQEQIKTFRASGIEGPINMLNLLKFKPDGGREMYAQYAEHAGPCLKAVGGKVVYSAEGRMAVIGPEHWDMILIVEYPSVEKFLEMATSEEYLKGVHLRTNSLEDSRLFCMQAAG
jgi:uncharacterized protein (DUF1330 family)